MSIMQLFEELITTN